MFQSILDDIKYNFRMGNTVTRIIILNVVIFVIAALIVAFSGMGPGQKGSIELFMENNFFISALPQIFIYKPWTLITYMFMHVSFMHILWNMIGLNMFGISTFFSTLTKTLSLLAQPLSVVIVRVYVKSNGGEAIVYAIVGSLKYCGGVHR